MKLRALRVSRREVNLGTYLHALLASAVLSVIALYLLYWGIIGFRPWA